MSKLTAQICAAGMAVLPIIVQMPSVAQSPGKAEGELIAIQKQWADARVKPDIAYLERLYATEFRVHTMVGSVASRADDIAMFKEGRIKPEFVRDEDMNVSLYGDVGIVTGIENVGGLIRRVHSRGNERNYRCASRTSSCIATDAGS